MKIALLTPSGGRPRQLELCRRMIAAQDMVESTTHYASINETLTLAQNLYLLLDTAERAKPDAYLVVEDDDFYPSGYVGLMAARFAMGYDIVGSERTRYYHVPTRGFRTHAHPGRSSLCATGFSASAMPKVRAVIEASLGERFLDIAVWNEAASGALGWACLIDDSTMVGIKGLPGRAGIGVGHDPRHYADHDADGSVLLEWVGPEFAATYLEWEP